MMGKNTSSVHVPRDGRRFRGDLVKNWKIDILFDFGTGRIVVVRLADKLEAGNGLLLPQLPENGPTTT